MEVGRSIVARARDKTMHLRSFALGTMCSKTHWLASDLVLFVLTGERSYGVQE